MALLHQATLSPTKLELLTTWLSTQDWAGKPGDLQQVAAYRFDDPADQVGIEVLLVRGTDGPVLQVPLTYRSEPLAGAEAYLVGTTEHSVLGRRWVYDGSGDPVWAAALATAVLTGGTQVELVVRRSDGEQEVREPSATVLGSGAAGAEVPPIATVTSYDAGPVTLLEAGGLELAVARVVGTDLVTRAGTHTLTGRWSDTGPVVLATVTPSVTPIGA